MTGGFQISVGDEAYLMPDDIWPDGDAPENPTVEDVIEQIKKSSSRYRFMSDWGFEPYVEVNGKLVTW